MKKSYRVKSKIDFNAIFKKGTSTANRKFVVYHLNRERSHFRVGLSVSKKLGNAVKRNQIKRRMRHVLQAHQNHLMKEDFVIIARQGVEALTYQEIKTNLLHVLKLANLYQEGLSSEKESSIS